MVSNRGMKVANANESRAMVLEALDGRLASARTSLSIPALRFTPSGLSASIGDGIARAAQKHRQRRAPLPMLGTSSSVVTAGWPAS